ncbi:FkbM family methyltransferase [Rhizorhabdus sp.]|uniref:FkbM family methyltransferase n=1 Tax=Rhizorhabdus sp. TaxID=1968843 RepID=UPI0019A7E4BC|nr:FkbM family methyltransferase [Rhizorhabdus sp.]MBD3760735.1 FkbM family methyltransferase [Rhizorhabdus sp.]
MQTALRRFAWRLGRHIYCFARGEPRGGDIHKDGEATVQKCVIDAIPATDTLNIFDIGANVGDWSKALFDQIGGEPARRVHLHAFEPVDGTRSRLKANLSRYAGRFDVNLHAPAISDKTGIARMHIVEDGSGQNSIHDLALGTDKTIEIDTITLSEIFDRLGVARSQLVKVDAEGHDVAIIRGARDLLRSGRIDVLQFEYNHAWVFSRSFLKDVFDLCEALPYHIARVGKASIEVFDHWHPELERFFNANYLLIREPALAWFDHHRGTFDVSNTYA